MREGGGKKERKRGREGMVCVFAYCERKTKIYKKKTKKKRIIIYFSRKRFGIYRISETTGIHETKPKRGSLYRNVRWRGGRKWRQQGAVNKKKLGYPYQSKENGEQRSGEASDQTR